MPYNPVQFESSKDKDRAREDLREAREKALEQAKSRFERRAAEEQRARDRGDDKWMLPSVEERLAEESGKKSKKHKKEKKHKKKSKKEKRKASSSESEGSSKSGDEWIEKGGKRTEKKKVEVASTSKPARDDWMMLPDLIPCITRDEIRQSKKPIEQREAEEKKKFMLDKPGQNERELNPHWKDGGSGLPEEQKSSALQLPSKSVGDQGSGWLRKALQRIYEQSEETGESPEDIAAERWGSLEKLETMIAEAEGRQRSDIRASFSRGRRDPRPKFAKPRDDFNESRAGSSRDRPSFHRPRDDDYEDRDRRRDRRSSDRGRDKGSPDRSKNRRSPERPRRSPERPRRSPDRPRRSPEKSRKSPERRRPRDDDVERERRPRPDFDQAANLKGRFQKPSDDFESGGGSSSSRPMSSGPKSWKKKKDEPVQEAQGSKDRASTSRSSRRKSPSPSSSSHSEPEEAAPAPVQVVLLSEKEMNEIGAKIVKAEILGNDTLAAKLKQQLEEARTAREEAKAAGVNLSKIQEQKDELVVLTRTDSKGFTRPLAEPQYQEPKGGRRKKQKVATHNKQGERERYFPDDGKFSLQDIFTREKLNTVEDSNMEFAKLVSKGTKHAGKGEFDMDEVFEEKARMQESDAKKQTRERDQAVREHQQVSNALDHCQWCVDSKKMLKHLLVALGTKAYLCLPPYQSLTEGHCLIVPTSHVTCGTMVDEDVWEELQIFRKAVTKMFLSKDEDVIFFESVRTLRGYPHMVIECVPVDKDSGALAPIYFKKAIQECEMEWATNVKLVNLASKGLRRSIPKGLPYFAVNFGDEDGFGHVIEDENAFPPNFAQEIIGGMLDLDHQLWRKRRNENFEAQRRKVVAFAKDWAPFDFTKKRKHESSSSSSESD